MTNRGRTKSSTLSLLLEETAPTTTTVPVSSSPTTMNDSSKRCMMINDKEQFHVSSSSLPSTPLSLSPLVFSKKTIVPTNSPTTTTTTASTVSTTTTTNTNTNTNTTDVVIEEYASAAHETDATIILNETADRRRKITVNTNYTGIAIPRLPLLPQPPPQSSSSLLPNIDEYDDDDDDEHDNDDEYSIQFVERTTREMVEIVQYWLQYQPHPQSQSPPLPYDDDNDHSINETVDDNELSWLSPPPPPPPPPPPFKHSNTLWYLYENTDEAEEEGAVYDTDDNNDCNLQYYDVCIEKFYERIDDCIYNSSSSATRNTNNTEMKRAQRDEEEDDDGLANLATRLYSTPIKQQQTLPSWSTITTPTPTATTAASLGRGCSCTPEQPSLLFLTPRQLFGCKNMNEATIHQQQYHPLILLNPSVTTVTDTTEAFVGGNGTTTTTISFWQWLDRQQQNTDEQQRFQLYRRVSNIRMIVSVLLLVFGCCTMIHIVIQSSRFVGSLIVAGAVGGIEPANAEMTTTTFESCSTTTMHSILSCLDDTVSFYSEFH